MVNTFTFMLVVLSPTFFSLVSGQHSEVWTTPPSLYNYVASVFFFLLCFHCCLSAYFFLSLKNWHLLCTKTLSSIESHIVQISVLCPFLSSLFIHLVYIFKFSYSRRNENLDILLSLWLNSLCYCLSNTCIVLMMWLHKCALFSWDFFPHTCLIWWE